MPLTRQQKKDLNITYLQSYIMTSNDAINVKLEAFRARIEDKLCVLFEKFRLGQSKKPKRSQHEESSDRKENQSEKGDQVQDSVYARMRVVFPRWEDGDPIG
ncbi:hypothetical protein B296_00023308 [Ensete ventricosum]|uniref:Uncharacterized protein n=1 Tax=Ensete ventricosum TaxID=4639 RepID=A0A426YBU4_ENSVE|nr:hypothetical protein B296_00023308 [Ensete ventricosum]